MVWMFVVGGLSMCDDLDGVTERRTPLPGPVAVLEEILERGRGKVLRDHLPHRALCNSGKGVLAFLMCGKSPLYIQSQVHSPIPRHEGDATKRSTEVHHR